MEAIIFVCALVCVMIGWIAAHVHLNRIHEQKLKRAYMNGANQALANRDLVKNAYDRHFHPVIRK